MTPSLLQNRSSTPTPHSTFIIQHSNIFSFPSFRLVAEKRFTAKGAKKNAECRKGIIQLIIHRRLDSDTFTQSGKVGKGAKKSLSIFAALVFSPCALRAIILSLKYTTLIRHS
jgi:hypothetical protein